MEKNPAHSGRDVDGSQHFGFHLWAIVHASPFSALIGAKINSVTFFPDGRVQF